MEVPLDQTHGVSDERSVQEVANTESIKLSSVKQPITWQLPHSGVQYTPILTDRPTDFQSMGYKLRFSAGDVKVLIVVTMYNEGPDELKRTLRGIGRNMRTFMERGVDWRKIIVCIVSDGRTKANKDTLLYATELGVFSCAAMDKQLQISADVGMHLFENIVEMEEHETTKKLFPSMQIMYALKESNSGKINSHWWFFEAFAKHLKPDYCVLIDVGTEPQKDAIYELYYTLFQNMRIGGCCGEITTETRVSCNPIVGAQIFEYKVSNILDKALETMCGYVSVLPGAFCAYRFDAIQGTPLEKYFLHLSTPLSELSPFKANMYLAEDRILCFELVSKKDHNYLLHYNSKAVAKTDVPSDIVSLVKQRRRWLNGSLFASVYALLHIGRLLGSSNHSLIRKLVFVLQYLHIAIGIVSLWFMVANFYLTFMFSAGVVLSQDEIIFVGLRYFFLALTIMQFVIGLGNRPEGSPILYQLSSLAYGLFFLITVALAIYVSADKFDLVLVAAMVATVGVFIIAGLLHGEILPIIGSFLQYTYYTPTFLIMFPIYSMSNLHDVSWGTKSNDENFTVKIGKDESADRGKTEDERIIARLRRVAQERATAQVNLNAIKNRFELFRTNILLAWMFSQGIYVSVLMRIASSNFEGYAKLFFYALTALVGIINITRLIGSLMYFIRYIMCPSMCRAMRGRDRAPSYPSSKPRRRGETV